MQSIVEILAQELGKKQQYIENVVNLIDEGNTIPFIARYRKEMHGAMDDTTLRNLETRLAYLRNLQQRRDEVKKSIENSRSDDTGRPFLFYDAYILRFRIRKLLCVFIIVQWDIHILVTILSRKYTFRGIAGIIFFEETLQRAGQIQFIPPTVSHIIQVSDPSRTTAGNITSEKSLAIIFHIICIAEHINRKIGASF